MIKRLAYRLLSVFLALLLIATQVAADNWLINSYRFGPAACTLNISSLGTGNSTTSGATLSTGATITAAVNDWLVAVLASDNAGSSGISSQAVPTATGGNNWFRQSEINRTAASAASDGATLSIWTAPVVAAVSGGTVTANFSPNTTSKAIQVYLVSPSSTDCYVNLFAPDQTGATGSVTSHAALSVGVTAGDTIFGAAAIESNATITGDSDTTNGSWSAIATVLANTGTSASSMTSSSQYKTVSATGSQDFAVTTASAADSARAYLILRPSATKAATLVFVGCVNNTSNLTTYTFASTAIGTAASDRILLFQTASTDNGQTDFNVSSLTVDSNAAAEQVDAADPAMGMDVAIHSLAWTSGTTASIAVTFSEAVSNAIVCVWASYGLPSATASDTSRPAGNTGTSLTMTLNVPAYGVALGVCNTDGNQNHTWTMNATERNDQYIESPGDDQQAAYADLMQGGSDGLPVTITCTKASAAGDATAVAASFGPAFPGPTLTFLQCVTTPITSNPASFTSQNFGTAAADRSIIAGIIASDDLTTHTVTAVTIGGITATESVDEGAINSNNNTAIAIAAVPTGASGTVSGTTSEAMQDGTSICLWAAYGLSSITAVSTNKGSSSSAGSINLTLSATTANGFAVGVCAHVASTTVTTGWTGLSNILDFTANAATDWRGSAARKLQTNGSSLTAACDWSGSGNHTSGAAAAYR